MLLLMYPLKFGVALRKESVDRNIMTTTTCIVSKRSLSARRAWIEIVSDSLPALKLTVALRKESVDRNDNVQRALY